MPPPPRACAAGRQRGARPAVVSGASAPGLRKYSGALGGRERRLSPEAGPSLAPESQAFLDLCCVSPGGPPRSLPSAAPGPAPRAPPGPADSPRGTQLQRLAEQPEPDSQASRGAGRWQSGREAEPGRARAGSDFPGKAGVWGGVGETLTPAWARRPRPRPACPPGPPRA